MFFFGALSGNILYVVLVISYLAGCSAWMFQGTETDGNEKVVKNNSTDFKIQDVQIEVVNYFISPNQLFQETAENSTSVKETHPLLPFKPNLFIPFALDIRNQFFGLTFFARPPPFVLNDFKVYLSI